MDLEEQEGLDLEYQAGQENPEVQVEMGDQAELDQMVLMYQVNQANLDLVEQADQNQELQTYVNVVDKNGLARANVH